MAVPTMVPVAKLRAIASIETLTNSSQLILSVLAACIAIFSLRVLRRETQLSSIPAVGNAAGNKARRKEFLSGKARDLYIEGYKKVHNSPEDIIRQN